MATLVQGRWLHFFLGLLLCLVLLMVIALATELIADIVPPDYLVSMAVGGTEFVSNAVDTLDAGNRLLLGQQSDFVW